MTQLSTVRHGTLEYRPAIDGLRAFAVLSVFIYHLNNNWLPGGFVGVDVFFVISGYLITSIIFKECEHGSFSLKKFYQRRIARIFPAMLMVGLATLIGAYFIYSAQDLASAGASLTAAVLSLENVKCLQQGNYFEITSDNVPFLHYWSLSVEEQFYIFFPLLFLLLFKYARKHLVLMLSFLLGGSFLASAVMTQMKPAWAFYLLPTRAWELLCGLHLGSHHRPCQTCTGSALAKLVFDCQLRVNSDVVSTDSRRGSFSGLLGTPSRNRCHRHSHARCGERRNMREMAGDYSFGRSGPNILFALLVALAHFLSGRL
jgi:peptidoglycan/LPS O-acetylase OafA/YrhL